MIFRAVRKSSRRLSAAAVLSLTWLLGLEGSFSQPPRLNERVLEQIRGLQQEKSSRTPAQQRMDSQLVLEVKRRRHQVVPAAQSLRPELKVRGDGRVLVDIDAEVTGGLVTSMRDLGATSIRSFPRFKSIRALVPIDQLEAVAGLPGVKFVRRADEAITNTEVSEGDIAHGADAARGTFGVNGTGVRVGVLSDSVDYLTNSQASGELGAVTVLPGQEGAGSGEGTAMLEIIHDLAPGADLYFATAFDGQASFAQNILDLHAAGCDIMVDDVFYFAESPFQDGVIAQAVNTVTAGGALYFSSAGNSGNKNDNTSGTWEGDFVDGGPVMPPYDIGGGVVHDFGGGATFNVVAPGGSQRRVDLFWSDPAGASTNDYDLYVLDQTGSNVVRSSTTFQNGYQSPYESVWTLNEGERIVIVKAAGTNRFLHLSTGRGRLTISTEGNIRGHTAAMNAFSVAAVSAWTSYPGQFAGGGVNPVETFSSDGPRRMFYQPDGTPLTPGDFSSAGGVVLQKPDLAAADGVSTSVPGFTAFYGTSAAAPHAAAIAALLKSHNPYLTPGEIRTALTATALDIEAAGADRDSGAGIVMANLALQSVPSGVAAPVLSAEPAVTFGTENTIVWNQEPLNSSFSAIAAEAETFTTVSLAAANSTPARACSAAFLNGPSMSGRAVLAEGPALSTWGTNEIETFEGVFPGSDWLLAGNPTWDDTNLDAHEGLWSGWCGASALNPSGGYTNDMNAWMIYGPFSLGTASNALMRFWYRNDSEPGADYFRWMASTNGVEFYGEEISGDQNTWQSGVLDLGNVPGLGNLCGATQVWIAFVFTSDAAVSGPDYEGAFIDDISIEIDGIIDFPDLVLAQPPLWNDKVPIGITRLSGTAAHTYNGPYYDNQTLYFNWAAFNRGDAPSGDYTVHVEVTGPGGNTWDWVGLSTSPGFYTLPNMDRAVGPLAAGEHTFRVWVDYGEEVTELAETNNYYERTITVQSVALPELSPNQPANWNNRIPVGAAPLNGTNAHNYFGPYYDNQTLYFNWSAHNQGNVDASNYIVRVEVTGGGGVWDWTNAITVAGSNTWLQIDQPVGPLAAGNHTFRIWVDHGSNVVEFNEANNFYERTINVNPALPVEYYAECSDEPSFILPEGSGWITETQFTFTNLVPGQTYWYRVRARQGLQVSAWSNLELSQQASLGSLSVSPATLDFGLIAPGGSVAAAFSVSNGGPAVVSGTAAIDPGSFAIVSGTPFTLDPGTATNVVINFTPPTPGVFGNAIVFASAGGDVTNAVFGRALDAPSIGLPSMNAGEFQLSFPTVPGFSYLVLYKDSLDDPVWQVLETLPGDGSSKTVTNAVGSQPSRFYLLRVE